MEYILSMVTGVLACTLSFCAGVALAEGVNHFCTRMDRQNIATMQSTIKTMEDTIELQRQTIETYISR